MPLYGVGSNLMGQLGLRDAVDFTSVPVVLDFFKDKKVVQIACGKLHALALCENNELYSWGVNDDCALGRDGEEEHPGRVEFKHKIKAISAGASHSAILTDVGHVYACGTFKSTNGILGFGAKQKFQRVFVRMGRLKGIVRMESGANHILMIDRDGCLWAVGGNESGQLSTQNRERHPKRCLEPEQISARVPRKSREGFAGVSGGGFHSLAIKKDGNVLSWGSNFNGQLGNGRFVPSVRKTDLLLGGVKAAVCGRNHTLLLTEKNELYGCGDNSSHQLGVEAGRTVCTPQLIMKGVDCVAAGCDFSYAGSNGALYSWGVSMSGETGQSENETTTPTKIDFDFGSVVEVACGTDFALVLAE